MILTTLRSLTLGALAVTGILLTGLVSADPPRGAPVAQASIPQLRISGKIEHVNLGNNTIIINDREFTMPADVRVHAGNGSAAHRSLLGTGMTVSYTYQMIAGKRTVTDIWLGR